MRPNVTSHHHERNLSRCGYGHGWWNGDGPGRGKEGGGDVFGKETEPVDWAKKKWSGKSREDPSLAGVRDWCRGGFECLAEGPETSSVECQCLTL